MPLWLNWVLAILTLVILLTIFIVSFVLYKKTPPPKGCEHLGQSEENCSKCDQHGCHLNLYYNGKKDEKKTEPVFDKDVENKENKK